MSGESVVELKAVESSLLDCPFLLTADPTRVVLKRGRLQKLNGSVFQLRQFVLTNDLLLWAKAERGGKLRYRGHINLDGSLFQKSSSAAQAALPTAGAAAAGAGRRGTSRGMAPDFVFQIVRMDFDPKSYTLKAESFADWFEWTTLIEERVDSFASQQREEHEKLITKLLRDETKFAADAADTVALTAVPLPHHATASTTGPLAASASAAAAAATGAATSSSASSGVAVPTSPRASSALAGERVNEMFVSLCDSLVQTEKMYADTLDCILKEYWIPLCQSALVDPRNEVTMLFGNVEKIAIAHVDVLSALEEHAVDEHFLTRFGPIVAEAMVVLGFLEKPDVEELYRNFAASSASRLIFYDQLVDSRPEFAAFVTRKNQQLPANHNLRKLIEQPLERLRMYISIVIRMRRFCPPLFAPLLDQLGDSLTTAFGDAKVTQPVSPRDLDMRAQSRNTINFAATATSSNSNNNSSNTSSAAAPQPSAATGASADDDDSTDLDRDDSSNKSPTHKRRSKHRRSGQQTATQKEHSPRGSRKTLPPQHKPPPLPIGQTAPPVPIEDAAISPQPAATHEAESDNEANSAQQSMLARIEALEETNQSLIMFTQQLQREMAELRTELMHQNRMSRHGRQSTSELASHRLSMHVQKAFASPAKEKTTLELINEKHEL